MKPFSIGSTIEFKLMSIISDLPEHGGWYLTFVPEKGFTICDFKKEKGTWIDLWDEEPVKPTIWFLTEKTNGEDYNKPFDWWIRDLEWESMEIKKKRDA